MTHVRNKIVSATILDESIFMWLTKTPKQINTDASLKMHPC